MSIDTVYHDNFCYLSYTSHLNIEWAGFCRPVYRVNAYRTTKVGVYFDEIGAVPALSPCEATRRVVDAYCADDEFDEIATDWPPVSREVVIEPLDALGESKFTWYVEDGDVDVWNTSYAPADYVRTPR